MKIESKRTREIKEDQRKLDEAMKRIGDILPDDETDDEWVKHFYDDDETQSLEERFTEL